MVGFEDEKAWGCETKESAGAFRSSDMIGSKKGRDCIGAIQPNGGQATRASTKIQIIELCQ